MRTLLALLIIVPFLLSCQEECVDCLNYDNEPYVNVQFLNQVDSSLLSVLILEYNDQEGENIQFFADTASSFIFPISMNDDESEIRFSYSTAPDFATVFRDSLFISYTRSVVRDERNFVNVICQNTELISNTFVTSTFVCGDTLGICRSNEAILRVFL